MVQSLDAKSVALGCIMAGKAAMVTWSGTYHSIVVSSMVDEHVRIGVMGVRRAGEVTEVLVVARIRDERVRKRKSSTLSMGECYCCKRIILSLNRLQWLRKHTVGYRHAMSNGREARREWSKQAMIHEG